MKTIFKIMKLIILPGNAKRSNEQWALDAEAVFSDSGTDVQQQRYSHWDTGGKLIDFDVELKKLVEAVKNESGYVIFGKSAGALLAIYGVYKGELKPERCVFVGLPLAWASEKAVPLQVWLEKFDIPTIILQQSEDPEASCSEVQQILTELKKENMRAVEIPGNDHKYGDFYLFKGAVISFILSKENAKENKDVQVTGAELKLK